MTSYLKHILREVHRRSLWRVLGAYVVASRFTSKGSGTMVFEVRTP